MHNVFQKCNKDSSMTEPNFKWSKSCAVFVSRVHRTHRSKNICYGKYFVVIFLTAFFAVILNTSSFYV